jgi:hypothetical protein
VPVNEPEAEPKARTTEVQKGPLNEFNAKVIMGKKTT